MKTHSVLTLMGMSGSGKSYWSRKLAACGFELISCDDRIEQILAPQLAAGGHQALRGVAAWMGWPGTQLYREREEKYLAAEKQVVEGVIALLEERGKPGHTAERGIVVDTTGSVVYLGEETCRRLRERSTIVYLAASAEETEKLIRRYLDDPKPVAWGEHFTPQPGESQQAAIVRCYPQLLAYRVRLYQQFADITLPISRLRAPEMDGRAFLAVLESLVRAKR